MGAFLVLDRAARWFDTLPYVCMCACDMFRGFSDAAGERCSKEMAQLAKCMGAVPKTKKYLSYAQWSVGYDYFAIGSAAVGQWSYAAARTHRVCLLYTVILIVAPCAFVFLSVHLRAGRGIGGRRGEAPRVPDLLR